MKVMYLFCCYYNYQQETTGRTFNRQPNHSMFQFIRNYHLPSTPQNNRNDYADNGNSLKLVAEIHIVHLLDRKKLIYLVYFYSSHFVLHPENNINLLNKNNYKSVPKSYSRK